MLERVEERLVGGDHLLQRRVQRLRAGLQSLQQTRAEQPGVADLVLLQVVVDRVHARQVAREHEPLRVAAAVLPRARRVRVGRVVERVDHRVDERQPVGVEVVVDAPDLRLRELDRGRLAVRTDDQLVGVVLLDELPRTTHGDLVHQVEEMLGREVGRVDRLRLLDVLADARDAQRGEAGVVADEVLDQRLEVGRASC